MAVVCDVQPEEHSSNNASLALRTARFTIAYDVEKKRLLGCQGEAFSAHVFVGVVVSDRDLSAATGVAAMPENFRADEG